MWNWMLNWMLNWMCKRMWNWICNWMCNCKLQLKWNLLHIKKNCYVRFNVGRVWVMTVKTVHKIEHKSDLEIASCKSNQMRNWK